MDVLGLVSLPTWLLVIALTIAAVYLYGAYKQTTFSRAGIPGPRGWPFLGVLPMVSKLGVFQTDNVLAAEYGNCVGYCMGNYSMLNITDAKMLKDIFVKDFHVFTSRSLFITISSFWQTAIGNAQGEHWKFLRTTLSPTFSTSKLKGMTGIIHRCLDSFVESMEQKIKDSDTVDFRKIFEGLTMDVICSTSVGIDVDSQRDPDNMFVKAATRLMKIQLEGNPLILATLFVPEVKYITDILNIDHNDKTSMEYIKSATKSAVRDRIESGSSTITDAVQVMVNSYKGAEKEFYEEEKGMKLDDYKRRGMTETEIQSSAVTFLLAGYDTTATTLMWTAYFLALHQDCQETAVEEIDRIVGRSRPTYDKVSKLEYLDMCVNETLRLCPALSRTSRVPLEDITVRGVKIKKGTTVNVPMYALHRVPEYWPNPEKFDPQRFSTENKQNIVPFSYMPFGMGPRNCIGMRLALMEVKMAMVTMLQRFRLQLSRKMKVPPEYERNVFVRPDGRLLLKVTRR